MKKRTLQEIADFFGGYIVKEQDGSIWIYDREPKMSDNGFGLTHYLFESSHYSLITNTKNKNHDWQVVKPKKNKGKYVKKRTLQEWADFFDCYIAKNCECADDEKVRGFVCFFENKPHLAENGIWYDNNYNGYNNGYLFCSLNENNDYELVNTQELKDHDWRVLIEPKETNDL